MYLSYSGHKTYKECPRQYWHKYIDKTRLPVPDNRVNTLYGSVVGILFELFYAERIWARSGVVAELEAKVDAVLDDTIDKCLRDGAVDWSDPKANYKSRESLRKDVVSSIPRGVEIIRHHRLLGPQAEAEVKLDRTIEGHVIGGRADFIMRRVRPHDDLVILDGKGSRHRDKYVDPQQLWWYAMLYRDQYGIMPDRLGFVFWRQEPPTSLDWVDFDGHALDALLAGVLGSIRDIESNRQKLASLTNEEENLAARHELFPTYLGGKCNLCAYQTVCREGMAYKGKRLNVVQPTEIGVGDFGFDGGYEE